MLVFVNDYFHALILWSKHHISCFQTDHQPKESPYFMKATKIVSIDHYSNKILFYWTNADENCLSSSSPNRKSLELQCENCTSAQKYKYMSQQFTVKKIYLMHFYSISAWKYIEMNIEWIIMVIPILVLKTLQSVMHLKDCQTIDRFFYFSWNRGW